MTSYTSRVAYLRAGLAHLDGQRAEIRRYSAVHPHLAAGDERAQRERARLHTVGHHAERRAVQSAHTLHADNAGTRALDPRAHGA